MDDSFLKFEGYKNILNFYDRVRNVVGKDIIDFPNEVIDYYEYAPLAETLVKRAVPLWEELDEYKMEIFQSAIVYQTALNAIPILGINTFKATQTTSIKIEYKDNNDSIKMAIEEMLDKLINELNRTDGLETADFIGFELSQ